MNDIKVAVLEAIDLTTTTRAWDGGEGTKGEREFAIINEGAVLSSGDKVLVVSEMLAPVMQ